MSWRDFLVHLRPREAHAHCDIPCGIYDPLPAQIAAMTVLRMHQLIEGLQKPGPNASKEELDRYENSLSRYVAVKEQHAELCKRELDILWHDYFKPEHLEKYPDLHNLFWNTIKLASKTKQEINKQAAEELVQSVQRIAEIFWETKGVRTHRVETHMPVGGQYVLPAA
ncbi:MAG TPA: superoxide dismutase, Ni [Dehalococcoidia bacterium]|nr:superoxide dismutase, Ni [Dehalococcoidia bacterium]